MNANLRKNAITVATLLALAFSFCSCRGFAQSSHTKSTSTSQLSELYAGYSALDYRSNNAPSFTKGHEREIADAIHHEALADRRNLRYTLALTGRGAQRVFVIFRDVGQPKDSQFRRLYVVVNKRNINYDPVTNTIVAQPPI